MPLVFTQEDFLVLFILSSLLIQMMKLVLLLSFMGVALSSPGESTNVHYEFIECLSVDFL